jgi:hypothetical protein
MKTVSVIAALITFSIAIIVLTPRTTVAPLQHPWAVLLIIAIWLSAISMPSRFNILSPSVATNEEWQMAELTKPR